MEITIDYKPSPKQLEATKSNKKYKLYGGAMGGGKSFWLCQEANRLSLMFPGNRIYMFREELEAFKDTTYVTLEKVVPVEVIDSWNKSACFCRYKNGSIILWKGFSESRKLYKEKKGSMECGAFMIDEAHEVRREDFLYMQSRLRWILPSKKRPPYCGLLASNPEDCWLKEDFVDPETRKQDYDFIKSLPSDNPYLPKDYVDGLKKNFTEEMINRYLYGDWDTFVEGLLIQPQVVKEAVLRDIIEVGDVSIGCDVARVEGMSADETVIYVMKGGRVIDGMFYKGKDTQVTGGNIVRLYHQFKANRVLVDDIGVGGGVSDFCIHAGLKTFKIVVNNTSSRRDRWKDLKAEIWWYAKQKFEKGEISIPNDPRLINQLSSVKYDARGRCIQIERKDDIKLRHGWSPDRADALVLAIWGGRFNSTIRDEYVRREKQEDFPKFRPQNPWKWERKFAYV